MTTKVPSVTFQQLIRHIAKDCKYNVYEVEDVMLSFLRVSQDALLQGYRIRLENFCSLEPVVQPDQLKYDLKTGERVMKSANPRIRCKTMQTFKEKLRAKRLSTIKPEEV